MGDDTYGQFKPLHNLQASSSLPTLTKPDFFSFQIFLLPAVADNDAKDAIGADYEAVYADDDIVRRTQG